MTDFVLDTAQGLQLILIYSIEKLEVFLGYFLGMDARWIHTYEKTHAMNETDRWVSNVCANED